MALDIEQVVRLSFESNGFYDVVNGIKNFVFYNDDEAKEKMNLLATSIGPKDRGEIVKEVSSMIEEKISSAELREENVIQTILMISATKKKKRR